MAVILRKFIKYPQLRTLCSARLLQTSAKKQQKWDLMSGVCLERYPVVSTKTTEFEDKFSELLSQMEYEKSHLSNFELQAIDDEAFLKKLQDSEYEETEADAMRVTANELVDKWESELQEFTFASRTTEADETNDKKSLDRKLDKKLTLVVKQKLGNQEHWVLPQSKRQEGESMRQAAERTLESLCGDSIKSKFVGNSPCGFVKYKYPKQPQSQDEPVGAKVFYFKAHHQNGQVKENTSNDMKDFLWLSKDELLEQLSPKLATEADKFIVDL